MKAQIRYSVRGLMDGSLSVLGVVIGALNPEVSVIISAWLAGSFANAASNLVAALTAESAEQYRTLHEVEEAMAGSLRGTVQERAIKRSALHQAIADSIASFVGGVVPVVPFFFLTPIWGAVTAFVVILAMMLALGVFLGRVTRQSVLASVGKMVAFTVATAVVSVTIQLLVGGRTR